MASLQRVLLTSLLNVLFQAGEDRERQVQFLLDESATLGQMDSLDQAVHFGRSFGIRLMFLFQSVTQIARCFPGSKMADFKATVASAFSGVNDRESAEEISKWIGQTTVTSVSEQDSTNHGGSKSNGIQDQNVSHNYSSGWSRSTNEVGRALIQPEEILQLPPRMSVVLLPNVRPILAEKMPYYEARSRSRVVPRLLHAAVCAAWLAVAWTGMAVTAWACTAGREHPVVIRVAESLYRTFSIS